MAVQEEIAWQISEALRLKLTGEQKKRLRKRHTGNADAYQEYLRGRYEWNNWTPDSFRRAIEHFERAIAYDPNYALAYAGIADSYGAMAYYGFVPPDFGYPRAREAALKASRSIRHRRRARVARPSSICSGSTTGPARNASSRRRCDSTRSTRVAHGLYAIFLITLRRFDEAVARSPQRPAARSAVSPRQHERCWSLYYAGRHEECVRETRRTRELAPAFRRSATC